MNPDHMDHQNDYRLYQNSPQHSNNSSPSGLLRFRSAPSSLLTSFANGGSVACEKGLMNTRCSSPESQRLSSRFSSPGGGDKTNSVSQSLQDMAEDRKPLANGYSTTPQLPPHYPRRSLGTQLTAAMDDRPYGLVNSTSMGSNLMRQNSSPAGLFSQLPNVQNGFGTVRGANYGVANCLNGDTNPSSSRLKINAASGLPSSLGLLSRISEIENVNIETNGPDGGSFGSGGDGDIQFYSHGFPFNSWSDSSHGSDSLSGLKTNLDSNGGKFFAGIQDGENDIQRQVLSHHLSLPKSSLEMAAMEKLLHLQDSVPCKVRAKRGCATHPRSIAERVRRTRISERMRKLQELVPNMDKQTNTADMLDLAVEYIKDLQKQYKTLREIRANCKCSALQRSFPNLSA